MPKHIDQPCKDGLTAACFAQEPLFARRAFSFRLLSAFVPPAMSRRLLTFLGLIRFDPAGNLPDWLNLPPWWIILPGAIIPPGWKFGDPIFDGLYQAPNFYQDRGWKYPVGPSHLSAMDSGPPFSPGGKNSPTSALWFNDDFITLDESVWTVDLGPASTLSIVSERLKYRGIDIGPFASIERNDSVNLPQNFDLEFKFEPNTGGDYTYILFDSGYASILIEIHPHATTTALVSANDDTIVVDQLIGSDIVYLAQVRDTIVELFLDGVSILSGYDVGGFSEDPGYLQVWFNAAGMMFLDYLKITSV